MNEKTGCPKEPDFQDYLDQQIPLPSRGELEKHVRQCPNCRQELKSLEQVFAKLAGHFSLNAGDSPTLAQVEGVMTRIGAHRGGETVPSPSPLSWWRDLAAGLGLTRSTLAGAAVGLGMIVLVLASSVTTVPERTGSPLVPTTLPTPGTEYTYELSAPSSKVLTMVGPTMATALPTTGLLQAGIEYRLPAMGKLAVRFKGANRLHFGNQARFTMAAAGLTLRTGEVVCDFEKNAQGYVITTPQGTITSNGTKFRVEVTPTSTRISLVRGVVILRTRTNTVAMKTPDTTLFLMANGTIQNASEGRGDPVKFILPANGNSSAHTLEGGY